MINLLRRKLIKFIGSNLEVQISALRNEIWDMKSKDRYDFVKGFVECSGCHAITSKASTYNLWERTQGYEFLTVYCLRCIHQPLFEQD